MLTFIALAILAIFVLGLAIVETFWPLAFFAAIALGFAWYYNELWTVLALFNWVTVPTYALIGVAWVFFRWTKLVEDRLKKRKKDKERWPDRPSVWEDAPRWENQWSGFSAYFFWWPVDMVAYILSDLLMDFWRFVSNIVSRSFNNYAKWRFESLDDSKVD